MKYFPRMIGKGQQPTEEEMVNFIGAPANEAWLELRHFIDDRYDIPSTILYYGAKYGWTFRYRKSGRTFCSLFPEKNGFTVLIVLGINESQKALAIRDELSLKISNLLEDTAQLHDGHWLWIHVTSINDVEDVKRLLRIKRKPKKKLESTNEILKPIILSVSGNSLRRGARLTQEWKSVLKADPLDWLLEPKNPAVRYYALLDLLYYSLADSKMQEAKEVVQTNYKVTRIFNKQHTEGYWESLDHPYHPK